MSADSHSTQALDPVPGALRDRLNAPRTIESLTRLLDRLDTMAFSLEALDGFLQRGDVIAENMAESVEELRASSKCRERAEQLAHDLPRMVTTGRQLAETATHADLQTLAESGVLERLTEPETLATINRLLDALPLLTFMAAALDEFLRRGDTVADSIADGVRELREGSEGLDAASIGKIVRTVQQLVDVGRDLIDEGVIVEGLPKVVTAGTEMIDAGMLDHEVVRTLGQLGKAAVDSYHEAMSRPIEPVGGLWGLLRLSKDPEIQKVIGLAAAIAKSFARKVL